MASDPIVIYNHLLRLCEYRGATVSKRLSESEFAVAMDSDNYVQILADRPQNDPRGAAQLVVVQFSSMSTVITSSARFSAFIDRIIKARVPQNGARTRDTPICNIILVLSSPVSMAITSMIASYRANPSVLVEHFLATMFLIVVPEHVAVPRHSIVSREDVEKMCSTLHFMPNCLPCIIASSAAPDPMAVWLGLRPGMIVRIDRPCETAGTETVYRRCV